MVDEVLKELLESGVHFGHQTRRWNPKMKPYIFGERSGIYIIDLEKTVVFLNEARDFAYEVAAKGGTLLFVGTKKQAREVIEIEARRCGMPFVVNRWMGGLLTNFTTVRQSVRKLVKIERMMGDGTTQSLKKKEIGRLLKEKEKLLRDLGGIREMSQLPQAVYIVDTKREAIAVHEANRLGIPIIGLVDTNCDPEPIEHPIPGNDDALKAIRYITKAVADSVLDGRKAFLEAETVKRKTAAEVQGEGTAVPVVAGEGPSRPAEAEPDRSGEESPAA